MKKVKVVLTGNRELETEVENFDPVAFVEETKDVETNLIALGHLALNKYQIEYAYEVKDYVTE